VVSVQFAELIKGQTLCATQMRPRLRKLHPQRIAATDEHLMAGYVVGVSVIPAKRSITC
jgi:hypothetical protein